MKDELDSLLQKEMDRKSFLKHVAIGFAALTGVAAALKTLNSIGGGARTQNLGYGSSTYGGKKQPTTSSKS
jgi:hypothetical protein